MPLLESRTGAKGVLFDLDATISIAEDHIEKGTARLTKYMDRVTLSRGDFFEADTIPKGAALYILGYIVHNWGDEEAVTILRNVAAAMPADGCILVIDQVRLNAGACSRGSGSVPQLGAEGSAPLSAYVSCCNAFMISAYAACTCNVAAAGMRQRPGHGRMLGTVEQRTPRGKCAALAWAQQGNTAGI